MKKWKLCLIMGIIEFLVAVVLMAWAFHTAIIMTARVRLLFYLGSLPFGNIDFFFLWPLVIGSFLLGSGVTDLSVVPFFYKMEKKKRGEV